METIFGHNPTKAELAFLGITSTEEEYKSYITQKKAFVHLAYLYFRRKDMDKAESYINRTRNYDTINSFWRIISHYKTALSNA